MRFPKLLLNAQKYWYFIYHRLSLNCNSHRQRAAVSGRCTSSQVIHNKLGVNWVKVSYQD